MAKSQEFEDFDQAIKTILRADPSAVKEALEAENACERRKTEGLQQPSVSDHEACGRFSDLTSLIPDQHPVAATTADLTRERSLPL